MMCRVDIHIKCIDFPLNSMLGLHIALRQCQLKRKLSEISYTNVFLSFVLRKNYYAINGIIKTRNDRLLYILCVSFSLFRAFNVAGHYHCFVPQEIWLLHFFFLLSLVFCFETTSIQTGPIHSLRQLMGFVRFTFRLISF